MVDLQKVVEKWSFEKGRDVMLPWLGSVTCGEAAEAIAAERTARIEAERLLAEREAHLSEARRGVDMIHNGLMDPTRPRQAVGEVAAHWLSRIDAFISRTGESCHD